MKIKIEEFGDGYSVEIDATFHTFKGKSENVNDLIAKLIKNSLDKNRNELIKKIDNGI